MSAAFSTLLARLIQHASAAPEKLIVGDQESAFAWGDLFRVAGAYAAALEESAFPQDHHAVPIIVDRSIHTPAAVLGCLLAGKAFAPLAGDQPPARIERCLEQLRSPVVINLRGTELEGSPLRQIGKLPSCPEEAAPVVAGPLADAGSPGSEELLYVLFTSGSTGSPKGVMVSEANLLNTLEWSRDLLDWLPGDKIGLATQFSFDISIFDLFTSLYWDVPLYILADPRDAFASAREIVDHQVTSLFAAPVFFSSLLRSGLVSADGLGGLRRIISGGDFFPPAHLLAWRKNAPQVQVFNVWGPTETSIVNTMYLVQPGDEAQLAEGKSPSIGRPHSRMPMALLDPDSGQPVSQPRALAELVMLGPCVTLGYLGDPQRTAEAYFIHEGQRAFHTNDLGFCDEAGQLYMAGRRGSMIKLGGYRVDLGEIEAAATGTGVAHLAAAFLLQGEDSLQERGELCLAIEPATDSPVNLFAFKQALRGLLPSYMVPKRIFIWESLPKNINGKVDRPAAARLAAVPSAS